MYTTSIPEMWQWRVFVSLPRSGAQRLFVDSRELYHQEPIAARGIGEDSCSSTEPNDAHHPDPPGIISLRV